MFHQMGRTDVVVRDIRMPFWSMVVFLVKLAIAAIPAAIIITSIVAAVVMLVFGGDQR